MIKTAELSELKRAVGPWPWRLEWIESCSRTTSMEMTLWLALVMFEGYEVFPTPRDERS